jgi:hypothetical protein
VLAGDSVATARPSSFWYSMLSISGAWLHLFDLMGYDKNQDPLRTHSTIKMTLQFERKYSTQGSGAPCHVSFGFFFGFYGISVGVLDRQPTKGSTRGRRMWPRRDR